MRLILVLAFCGGLAAQPAVVGTVRDAETGLPVGGASVLLEQRGHGSSPGLMVSANAAGEFHMPAVAPGTYIVSGAAAGYIPSPTTVWEGTEVKVMEGQPPAPVHLRISRAGSMEGTVLTEDGWPVPGARITAGRAEATTDAAGRFVLNKLPAGEYEIGATIPEDFRLATQRGDFGFPKVVYFPEATDAKIAGRVLLASGEQRRGLPIRLRRVPLVALSGVVLSAGGGKPLAGGEAELKSAADWRARFEKRALADGRFHFPGLMPGKYELTVYRDGTPFVSPVNVSGGGLAEHVVQWPRVARVSGVVTAPRTAPRTLRLHFSPARGIAPGVRVAPDTEGRFAVEGLTEGEWSIGLGWSNVPPGGGMYGIASIWQGERTLQAGEAVHLQAGENGPLQIAVAETFLVTGLIVDSAGQPVANGRVQFYDGRGLLQFSRADGRFSTSKMAGTYVVSAWPARVPYDASQTRCANSQTIRITGPVADLRVPLCP